MQEGTTHDLEWCRYAELSSYPVFCVLLFSWDCYFFLSLSVSLCLWSVCWHFPWQATGLFGISRDCIPTNVAAVIILVLVAHFPEEQQNCARCGSCALLPLGRQGGCVPTGGTPRGGWSSGIGACHSPWERRIFFPSSKRRAAGRVSLHRLFSSLGEQTALIAGPEI